MSNHLPQKETMELARSSPEFAKLESEKADLELSLVEMQSKLQAVEAHAASVSEKLQAVEAEAKHPIFGNLVSDFGYKKIYAMNPAIVCDPQKSFLYGSSSDRLGASAP